MSIQITKHSGETVPFSEEKLRHSLFNVGAAYETIDEIVEELKPALYDGIHTKEIYKRAHSLLKKREYHKASRYQLKQAMLQLGPTGYPFELFIGELLKARGFSVQTGTIFKGQCVNHEVDVLAKNDKELLMIECKFHNQHGYKTDVKVPLYIQSRFKDLESVWKQDPELKSKRMKGGVFTNARLTQDAIDYGKCAGLELLSWDYPNGNGLKELINRHGLHPITSLQTLSKLERQYLINQEIITVKSVVNNPSVLEPLQLTTSKMRKLMAEMSSLCNL